MPCRTVSRAEAGLGTLCRPKYLDIEHAPIQRASRIFRYNPQTGTRASVRRARLAASLVGKGSVGDHRTLPRSPSISAPGSEFTNRWTMECFGILTRKIQRITVVLIFIYIFIPYSSSPIASLSVLFSPPNAPLIKGREKQQPPPPQPPPPTTHHTTILPYHTTISPTIPQLRHNFLPKPSTPPQPILARPAQRRPPRDDTAPTITRPPPLCDSNLEPPVQSLRVPSCKHSPPNPSNAARFDSTTPRRRRHGHCRHQGLARHESGSRCGQPTSC